MSESYKEVVERLKREDEQADTNFNASSNSSTLTPYRQIVEEANKAAEGKFSTAIHDLVMQKRLISEEIVSLNRRLEELKTKQSRIDVDIANLELKKNDYLKNDRP